MTDFTRPRDGIKFNFLGMQTNNSPDSVPPGKYVYAQNVRAYSPSSIRTRPGQVVRFGTLPGHTITDIGTYSELSTDNLPRILARDSADGIFLDLGNLVGTLFGGGLFPGVSMIPFRPNASPNPWMYIANNTDYQKFSAPIANVVTAQKVGIAEPQSPPDAAAALWSIAGYTAPAFNAGTAGAETPTANRVTDTVGTVFAWPSPAANLYSIQVSAAVVYQRFQDILINANYHIVADVYQPLPATLTIQGIYYFTGVSGRCVVVPGNIATTPGDSTSLSDPALLAGLRRGALVKIAAETCMVLSVTPGPNGTISFETSTTGTHTTADNLAGVPAISVYTYTGAGPVAAQAITSNQIAFAVTVGIGTMSGAALSGINFAASSQSFQPDDYIHFSLKVDTLANLNEMKILFDVGDGTFTQNFYYYTVRPADIVAAIANTLTQIAAAQTVAQRAAIDEETAATARGQGVTFSSAQTAPGSSQWTEILFPIRALTRVGNDQTKSLQDTNNIRFTFNAAGTINVALGSFGNILMGKGQPDVGDVGAPLLYRVRPRSSVTGAVGNPSPATRYGTNARRQSVTVLLPSAAYDTQIDTWDVFRYGGAVTSWRFVGSVPSASPSPPVIFTDNFDDAAAQAGDALDFDNFEPWPSIDIPTNGTASVVNGTTAVVSTTNTNILKYLPGTLVRLGGQNVYTLWTRPTLISGTNYLLQFAENAGAGTNFAYQILEPVIANQHLPYLWGPDAAGTVFACGDALRAGTVYFAKNYAPDSAPDAYNMEITPPTEPLVGGEVLDGLSFVASTERWWALYPQSGNAAQRYAPVQQPFPRGLAAPFGHCTDGASIYWWAKDGIYSSSRGSLTDADLYNLFPHEGVIGETVTYLSSTLLPPDYSRAGFFRLTYVNGYLYAVYQNTLGTYVNLVCQVATGAWCVDTYGDGTPVSVFHHPEQQAGTLSTSVLTPSRYDELLMGDTLGRVTAQVDLANDVNTPIACVLGTREDDAGDARAPKQWGDLFLDATPAATGGIVVSLVSLGAVVTTLPATPTSAVRTRQPLSVSAVGNIVADFLGLRLTWTDNFLTQSVPTTLNLWQPSFVIQPARDIEWFTFGTAFGMDGYHHLRQIALAYVSTAPITLTIASYDGLSPAPIVIPSSAGAYVKLLFPVGANKGLLHNFHAVSSAPFQVFLADSEFYVGAWGRVGAYLAAKSLGGRDVEPAIV